MGIRWGESLGEDTSPSPASTTFRPVAGTRPPRDGAVPRLGDEAGRGSERAEEELVLVLKAGKSLFERFDHERVELGTGAATELGNGL